MLLALGEVMRFTSLAFLFLTALTPLAPLGCITDADPPAPIELAHPPARPTLSTAGTTRWFVLDHYQLGLSRKEDGVPDANAWKRYGYDLDGRATSKEDSKDNRATACNRVTGSPSGVLADGERGIDNAFAQHFMSVVKSLMFDVETLTNDRVATGGYTFVLRLDNVGAADNANVPGALWLVGPREAPKFGANETWPVAATSEAPLQTFANGYMAGGVWVSGDLGKETIDVGVPFLGDALITKLVGGVMSVRVSDGADGIIAGAIRGQDFMDAMTPSLMRRGICPGNASFDVYQTIVKQSADMMVSAGPGGSSECNAMSVGIGFTMKPIKGLAGSTGAPPKPKPECDAGG